MQSVFEQMNEKFEEETEYNGELIINTLQTLLQSKAFEFMKEVENFLF